MTMKNFPTRRHSDVVAEVGVNIVSTIVNDELGWIFRRNHQEHDFGVDGYIDYVNDDGGVTGKFLAIQIKTGGSYLNKSGTVHWYSDTKEHLNYFLNLPVPIILAVCDPDSNRCYWAQLRKEDVDFRGDTWRFPIPKSQILSKRSADKIKKILGPEDDHLAEFEEDRNFTSLVESSSFIQYCVPREDVENRNISNLKTFLARITRNEKLVLAVQGKLYISTYGYESDAREVFQIKDVRKWARKARKKLNYWYLCANKGDIPSTLTWVAAATSNVDAELVLGPDGTPVYRISGSPKEIWEFEKECFHGLNEATDRWGWSVRRNYEISKLIHDELLPDLPFPGLKGNGA